MGRVGLRWVTATSVALSLMVAAAPAQAAAPETSHLREAAAPATVLIGTRVVVSGAVSPSVKGKPVYLQRVVAGKWKTIGHVASGKLGVYSFSVKATGKAGTWSLRVMRPASSAAKAVVGKTLKVRLTKTAYKITAVTVSKVNAGNPIAVAGVVTPQDHRPGRAAARSSAASGRPSPPPGSPRRPTLSARSAPPAPTPCA